MTNKGLGYSLNKGVTMCSNEIIFRMDSDDIMHPNRLNTQYNFMMNNKDCMLCCSQVQMFNVDNDKKIYTTKTNLPTIDYETFKIKFKADNNYHWLSMHPTWCFRKSAILKIGNYDESIRVMFEDVNLAIRILKNYGKIYNLNDVLLKYRIHDSQVTTKNNSEYLQKISVMINNIIDDKI